MTRRTKLVVAIAVLGLLLVGLLLWAASVTYEVVDKGDDLRPYDSGLVYELRIADSITIYADEESRKDTDLITSVVLVMLATAAGMTALLLRAARGNPRLRRFYGLAALGLGWLALDDLMGVHETVGHNLLFLTDLPGVAAPDDVLFALYAIPAIAFVVAFWDVILRARRWFAVALGLLVAAGAADVATLPVDEPLEVLVGLCLLVGFTTLVVTDLSEGLGLDERASDSKPVA